jgi:uncharacterized SAM-binding protein YcdF (DUF218 family)
LPELFRVRRAARILAIVAVTLSCAVAVWAYHAASWLRNDDAPIKADAIVVLAGRFERTMHAADLYRAGYAPIIVLSEAVPEASSKRLEALGIRFPGTLEIHRQVLQAKGVPAGKVELLGAPALSTADEAASIAARFGQAGRKLIVVTSPSHVHRARMMIARALEGRGVELAVCATPFEQFPDQWWRSQDAARDVLLEWTKILFYLGGGRFRATP